MNPWPSLLLATLFASVALPSSAQSRPDAISVFMQACVDHQSSRGSAVAALGGEDGWVIETNTDEPVDLPDAPFLVMEERLLMHRDDGLEVFQQHRYAPGNNLAASICGVGPVSLSVEEIGILFGAEWGNHSETSAHGDAVFYRTEAFPGWTTTYVLTRLNADRRSLMLISFTELEQP